jgi:hypothetical protein
MHPHMHLRGKDMTYMVIYPDGREEIALRVPVRLRLADRLPSWRSRSRCRRTEAPRPRPLRQLAGQQGQS